MRAHPKASPTRLDGLGEAIEDLFLLSWRHLVQRSVGRVDRLEASQARVPCEAARAEDHRQDADPLRRLGGSEQRRQLILIDEVGGEEVGADQEHRGLRRIESGADFLLPVVAGPDVGVVPAIQAARTDQRLQMPFQPFQPLLVGVAVADEDLSAAGGRRWCHGLLRSGPVGWRRRPDFPHRSDAMLSDASDVAKSIYGFITERRGPVAA